ncbi:MAG: TATA box-binding protein, partial [Desulfurococcaceae archaeon]
EALEKLVEIGSKTSLRYAVQLLEPARIIAEERGSQIINVEDVDRAKTLFIDVSASVQYLRQYEQMFLK